MRDRPGRCPTCGKKFLTWTPEAIREAAHDFYRERGHSPTIRDWKKASPHNPSSSLVQYIYGSWGEFLDDVELPRNPRNRTRWTPEAITDSILEFRFAVGRWPVAADFIKATPTQPNIQTIQRVFGTWTAARKAAGYTGLERAQHRGGELEPCKGCGVAVNDYTPGCTTCRRRQRARVHRELERRGPAPERHAA